MKNSKLIIALFLGLCFIACDSTSYDKASLKKEKELLEKERSLLEKEKELLQKEKEVENKTATASYTNSAPQPITTNSQEVQYRKNYSPMEITGTWDVKMNSTFSDCTDFRKGSIFTEQWNISYVNEKILVKAIGSSTNTKGYAGTLSNNSLNLSGLNSRSKITINLALQNGKVMKGTRRVSNPRPCSIEYYIELNR